nr:DNA methyltransferase [Fibrisoma montanum]
MIQLETLRLLHHYSDGTRAVLIVCPLGVKHEFVRDGLKLGITPIRYITSTDEMDAGTVFYITNYERIRRGQIDASQFLAVTFDEASILRSLDTDTTQTILETFQQVPFRFVCTATPSPNRYLELINYAEYLGIMDRGQALTRFFERDSTTAGNLTLYAKREREFWLWMSSWACFITKPSDLGYDDAGYDLPELTVVPHLISFERAVSVDRKTGQSTFVPDSSKSLTDAAKEKRESMPHRIEKMAELVFNDPHNHWLIWHHLEDERKTIQHRLGTTCKSVWGSQNMDQREEFLTGFAEGRYPILSTKPEIAGSGVNLQYHCHKAVFVGIDYKFNDFVQAVHRIFRFGQERPCEVHVIYTDAETEIYKTLMQKWQQHRTLQSEMTDIIRRFGLNSDLYQQELKRELFTGRKVAEGVGWTLINNDCVAEWETFSDDSLDLIVTSIPFGNHYEYSENYNCFGHNETNEKFFEQMDFLVPHLYRTLKPGRIAAIHVKDRIRYSYMNGTGFTSIDPFSDETTACFRKHGFHLLTRITVDTDVVQENNQTYRLGWSEACKDMTKMGAGLPEYVLVFRKAPTSSDNAYADVPVTHSKEQYSRGRWQLDAHAHWKTSGERLVSEEALRRLDLRDVLKLWKALEATERYDYHRHVAICEALDRIKKLPSTFMAVPPQANHPDIWDDITRMRTLNSEQVKKGNGKHICPLQLDIIERLIERYSNPGELVADPFGGIMSVPYQALKMKRRALATELTTAYWQDGIKHVRGLEVSQSALSIFDLIETGDAL